MADARDRRSTQVGRVAASDIVISKQIFNRETPPPSSAARLRAPRLGDVPGLFGAQEVADDEGSWQHLIARLSSAAIVYSAVKTDLRQADKLLRENQSAANLKSERELLSLLHDARQNLFMEDRSCPHCRLLYGSLYRGQEWKNNFPPIQVVHHGETAKVKVTFDPDTFISEANVQNYQLIVSERVAKEIIKLAHPLEWANAPGTFFRSIRAVHADGSTGDFKGTAAEVKQKWEQRLADQQAAYILEDVEWPINQDLRSNAENILRISNFSRNDYSLKYDYALQRCVRTNFGVAWEPSGLDIDGGKYQCSALRLIPADITHDAIEQGTLPLAHLTRRDVAELNSKRQLKPDEVPFKTAEDIVLYNGWAAAQDKVGCDEIANAVANLVTRLEDAWDHQFYLLTVCLSKRLHFTVPEFSPIELWHLLTWTAPAFLFAFLNAVCQAPHFLVKQEHKHVSSGGAYGV